MTTAALDAPILKEIGETLRGLEALVKVMQKGQDIGGVPGTAVSSLALLVLLHMIWKMITQKLKDKPKT